MLRRVAGLLVAVTLLLVTGCSRQAPSQVISAEPPVTSGGGAVGGGVQAGTPAEPVAAVPSKPVAVRLYPAYRLEQGEKRWGYVDETGSFTIAPQYTVAEEFGPDGLAVVYQNGKAGLIGQDGQVVVAPKVDYITEPADGVRIVHQQSTRQAIDSKGAVMFESTELVGPFAEGLALIQHNGKYGYVDRTGKVVIEPQFTYAHPFAGGKAPVKVDEGKSAVIDTTGKRLLELPYPNIYHLGDGMVAFQEQVGGKWGYASLSDGRVAIAPQFVEVAPFADGLAVVQAGQESSPPRSGVIDRQGAFVIPPKYSDIQDLGGGLFAVGEPHEYYVPAPYVRHALFTAEGKQLTEFLYYDVTATEQGLCVTDDKDTYFIDRAGRRLTNLPAAKGIGSIRFVGNLVAMQIDGDLSYVTRDGKPVWQADDSWPLAGGGRVVSHKYRPDRYVLMRYPEVTGLADSKAQAAINDRLKALFLNPGNTDMGDGQKVSVQSGFTVQQVGRVLVVKHSGDFYPIGAAHGMPAQAYYHFDLTTGAQYQLADLFKPGSPYPERLRELVSRQIAQGPQGMVNDNNPAVKPDHGFAAGPDDLLIYWDVYAIGPYAAGFPSFRIPYAQLMDLINTEGAFWKALTAK